MEAWRQWQTRRKERKILVQEKSKRTYLTPTGLLMEGDYTHKQLARLGQTDPAERPDQRTGESYGQPEKYSSSHFLTLWSLARGGLKGSERMHKTPVHHPKGVESHLAPAALEGIAEIPAVQTASTAGAFLVPAGHLKWPTHSWQLGRGRQLHRAEFEDTLSITIARRARFIPLG